MAWTLIIIGCTSRPKSPDCLKRAEYTGKQSNIEAQIRTDGWTHWNRVTGNAICRECREYKPQEKEGES